jgi:hypothetical protein
MQFTCARLQSASGHYRWLFQILPADAADRETAVAVMARAGWDHPGWYTDDLAFDCTTTDGRLGVRAYDLLRGMADEIAA